MANITIMMDNRQKLLAIKIILPVVADLLEDLKDNGLFKYDIKNNVDKVINAVRRDDDRLFKDLIKIKDTETYNGIIEQTVNGERLLKNFLKDLTRYETRSIEEGPVNHDQEN